MSKVPSLLPNPRADNPTLLASFLAKIATTLNQLLRGNSNTVGSITLTANSTTTVLKDPNVTANCKLWLTPTTADASTALASLWPDPTTIVTGESAAITLKHASNAATDQTFWYEIRV